MRNWNLSANKSNSKLSKCFYSTYEELKPRKNLNSNPSGKEFLQYLWGIETQT